MRLTKLELLGFKSFARKTELQFCEGITAVIGPNGSGKSNIADAVRWVLGEQSAKALRGSRMEDVIFNGTQERRAQAFCEVMLTFDNSDGTLPLEFSEVTITRRVYRSGDSEYCINRNPCRLKDIHELFRDTGIGKEGYSIISQGRVDEILSNKSNDRRVALEEAAGVTRYRARKEESLRKLDHTRKNLERLEDILAELDAQREPLQEQAEKARAYLTLRDELKDLELNVFLHQYDRVQERMKTTTAAIEEISKETEALEARVLALAGKSAGEEEALRETEERLGALQAQLLAEISRLEAHTGEVAVLKERRENLQKECERLETAIVQGGAKCEGLEGSLKALDSSDTDGQNLLRTLDIELGEAEAELALLNREIADQEVLLEAQKNSIMDQLNRLSDAKSQLSRMDAMAAALKSRRGAVEEERRSILDEHRTLTQEQQEAEAAWESLQAEYRDLEAELQAGRKKIDEAKAALEKREAGKKALEEKFNAMRSRANVLEEMARAHEGYYSSVRNTLRDCDRDSILKENVLGVVAELISVPQEYETAVEMALGNALQNIVTPTAEAAKIVIAHLRKRQYGRATFLPLTDLRVRTLSRDERSCLKMPGCIGVASELISCEERYRGVADFLLGRTVLVESLEAGIAINRRQGASFRIATLAGDIINPGGSMTGGSVQKREFSILGREREIKQLRLNMKTAEGTLREHARALEEARSAVQRRREEAGAMEGKLHAREIEHVRHKEKRELIERDIQLNLQKQARSMQEQEQIDDNLLDIERERETAERLSTGIEKGSAATQEDVLQSQHKLASLRKQGDALNAALTERKVRRMAVQKEEDALRQEKKRIAREIEQARQAIDEARQSLARNRIQEEELGQRIVRETGALAREQAIVEEHRMEQQAMEEEKQRRTHSLSDERLAKDELNGTLRELEERKHKQQLQYSRAELEFATMQERIMADYNISYEEAIPYRRQPFGVTAAHVRIDTLRKEIRALGNINVNAVEDYEALSERCDMLHTQCEDLHKAEADLGTLIEELTRTMEKQFLSQFAIIQENFTTVFSQLFDGGHAELRLNDPKDALNCEIDIIAQPPGKKLQLLTLLSGGERALTAIALLFAMLKLKPTVFCILDEIETSLDEVNVARFANYLKNYSDDTQFILITHRKGSMEVCNALYGVAMEERGISRLVSAHFTSNAG